MERNSQILYVQDISNSRELYTMHKDLGYIKFPGSYVKRQGQWMKNNFECVWYPFSVTRFGILWHLKSRKKSVEIIAPLEISVMLRGKPGWSALPSPRHLVQYNLDRFFLHRLFICYNVSIALWSFPPTYVPTNGFLVNYRPFMINLGHEHTFLSSAIKSKSNMIVNLYIFRRESFSSFTLLPELGVGGLLRY